MQRSGGERGGFGLPLSAGSSMVGEARPREGMLGNRTEPGKAIQGCSALCRPAERERATGTLPRRQEARDVRRTKGEKASEYDLQVLNIGSDVDLKQPSRFRDRAVLREKPRHRSYSKTRTLCPGTAAPATRLLANQKHHINSKSPRLTPSLLDIRTLGSQGYSVNFSETSGFER